MGGNPQTIVATIVGLVSSCEELSREELLDLMAATTFPHPKARPQDRGWCQGYVAGAIRSGFLSVVAERSTSTSEGSTTAGEASSAAGA